MIINDIIDKGKVYGDSMKVIKRDGTIVDYDKEKIVIAIGKANAEVPEEERATDLEIKKIIKYIESLNKKRILVEDIQDLIEIKLMEMKRFELAKHYIVYRYTRALVRKSNTTDESILRLIRNDTRDFGEDNLRINSRVASNQRNYIAGEVSRDLTKRVLIREKIVDAHEKGVIFFHDMDYFIHPVFNSSLIDIEDMLDNGTVINGETIESPKSFRVASIVLCQIIADCCSNQYGGLSLNISALGKYLKRSYDKNYARIYDCVSSTVSVDDITKLAELETTRELEAGVQTIQYQINTLMTTSGKNPGVTLFMYLNEKDPYINENARLFEEMLKQRIVGIKNEFGELVSPISPKLVYVLDENNALKGGKYDFLTTLAMECAEKRNAPYFISAKMMREQYEGNVFSPMGVRNMLLPWRDNEGNYKFTGRFNQGIVTINLPQIGIVADGDMDEFWKLLDERLDLCREALMIRHHALMGGTSDTSPIHWQNGAIARLGKGEKIDRFLNNGYSTLSVGYIGLYEVTKLMTGESQTEEHGRDFAIKVMQYMKDKCLEWKRETGIGFVLYGTPADYLSKSLAKIDLERYGKIKEVTDKGYYTNSYHVDYREKIDTYERLNIESEFQKLSIGGFISYVDINEVNNMEELVKYIYENVLYVGFKTTE